MATTVDWLACDTVTGQVLAELPDLRAGSPLECRLGDVSTCDFELPIALAGHGAPPNNWEDVTNPQGLRRMLVAVLAGAPVWAGLIVRRRRGTAGVAKLAAATLEHYLDVRYVADHVWTDKDEASVIAAGLLADATTTEGIGLSIDAPATGTLRSRTYAAYDDRTVLSAMQSLSGVQDGPEWTIALDWDTPGLVVAMIARVRSRIGVASSEPVAVFSTQGESSAAYSLDESYTDGKGANHIVAVSSGEGAARPASAPARDETLLAVGPRIEHRFTPSTSITQVATLDAHAARTLELMARGAQVWTLDARADADPVLGRDWNLGDDVAAQLVGHGHPDGVTVLARAIGWQLDVHAGRQRPLLLGGVVQ